MSNKSSERANNVSNAHATDDARPSSSSKSTIVFGLVLVGAIFLGFGVWSATAPLARAVSAIASLTVKGERKQVQHFEGGIVGSLHVTEGQMVDKGDLLVALNPVQASAAVARHYAQLNQALAREARLESELSGDKSISLKGKLLARMSRDYGVIDIIDAEQRNLIARRKSRDGTVAILQQRIDQLDNEISGLKIQRVARIEQLGIFQKEIIGLRDLFEKGYYPKSKILAVERAIVELRGRTGNDQALIARARSARGEAENQILSVKQRFQEEVVAELRDVQVELADINERMLVAKDILKRIEIKAPRSGIVQGVKLHTVGGVIGAGDVLMEIAPQDEELMVTAQVSPADIDSLAIGQRAEVRLTALNSRTTPAIYGYVKSISGDSLTDALTNLPYFLAKIDIPLEERQKLGNKKLTAGMPAEVLIQTGERTALNYLLKPISDAFSRGLNEE
jgi:HlyD family type I secretion membrane fusion protein